MSDSLKKIPIKVESTPSKKNKGTEYTSLFEASKKVYPRSVTGFFAKWRVLFLIATQFVYLGVPWIQWEGRQAILWDMVNRKFYIFGLTFWPQDFYYLAAFLMISAFGLFVWTAIAGRLWCGYACPQTVYTEMMLWIEHFVEGDRNARIKLDKEPWSFRKARIKVTKHAIMIAISLFIGFTLVGYFTPILDLVAALPTFDYGPWETFWIFFYAGFTYLLAGIMREQVCKYMCPYARFQSVMFDPDTLIISYDAARGEPRGARKKTQDASDLGSCVDCKLCVNVCPVGIDIRDGLQYECIGCAACVDVCDEVMIKTGQPTGLVRYTTESVLEGKYSDQNITKHLLRPRVLMYSLLLIVLLGILVGSLISRKPFKVDVLRDRASLVRETNDGLLENSYQIRFINVSEKTQVFKVNVTGLAGITLSSDTKEIKVEPNENVLVSIQAQATPEVATRGSHEIDFIIELQDEDKTSVTEKSSFIGE